MSLRERPITLGDGSASFVLVPDIRERRVAAGGQEQVQSLVPFKVAFTEESRTARTLYLAIPDFVEEYAKQRYGASILDDEMVLSRLFRQRFAGQPSAVQELPVGKSDIDRLASSISVSGSRVSGLDWEEVRTLTRDQLLAALTPEQRETAQQMRVPEEDYARAMLANRKGLEKMGEKARRFARLLRQKLGALNPTASIEKILLDTFAERFEVEIAANGTTLPLTVSEKLVDELFESGSIEAEARLVRILEFALPHEGAK